MPPKRRAPKANAPKPAEEKDDPSTNTQLIEKRNRNGKQAGNIDDPFLDEEPQLPKARKGKQTEKLDDPLSEEDMPKSRKGKKAAKLEDPLPEKDETEVVAKTRKGKKAEKLDKPLSDEEIPDVQVTKTKKGKETKQVKKPEPEKVKVKLPAKKRGVAKEIEKPDEEMADEQQLESAATDEAPAKKKRGGAKQVETPDEEVSDKKQTKKQLKASEATDEAPAKKKRGATKQTDKQDTKEVVEDLIEELPARKRRGAAPKQMFEEEDSEEDVPVKKKRGAKAAVKKTETKAAPLNQTATIWDNINFDSDKKNKEGKVHNLKITSWNVDGIRSWLTKDGSSIMNYSKPDIFCLQETRCSDKKLPEELTKIDDYHVYWCPSQKEGYAGVGVYSKIVPLDVIHGIGNDEHDNEGRCITCEYDGFYLVNVYVPNAGRGLKTLPKRLEWNELFKAFIKNLDEKKPVIVCGDMNVAHNEIDLSNPKSNKKNAGFTQEERDGMTDFLKDGGFVDTFRELYPEEKDVYTFWSYMAKARAKNVGWRLDYFIVSERIGDKVCDNVVNKDVYGSDHCPITLFINI
ncbi:unnamed protein product [Ceutorhynchus assimilis]|uniref:DNA-(apurinic or apyrimidinic site) endonuclease n=1 Tax=Ceutorhynchus assimilis TaxID=467358 RepID=A0A9N9MT54_9CUCU|nr:unnamed protein product [Ceutorhynchus assimilis]